MKKIFISCLESRILWLEKQLEQKPSIIEKLLITNHLTSQDTRESSKIKEEKFKGKSENGEENTSGKKLKAEEKTATQKQHAKSVSTLPVTILVDKEDNGKTLSNIKHGKEHQAAKKKRIFLLGHSIVNGIEDPGLSKQHNVKNVRNLGRQCKIWKTI